VHEAQQRAAGRSGAQQLIDAAGDAATAALTAVSVAADEAQARLATKARMRELEHAVVTARAGGRVDVSPPTIEEATKLARRMEPASAEASIVRGLGFVLAGVVALAMTMIGGFGWLGFGLPLVILIAGGSFGERIQEADRSRKARRIQLDLARPAPVPTEQPIQPRADTTTARPRLREDGDPRTRAQILAVLERLIGRVGGLVPQTDVATLRRIADKAALALPATDGPLDLTDHDMWLLRQICIDHLPGALEHFLALPKELASEPVLDGRSARQVLDEQLEIIERRLEEIAARSYRRNADGLLIHARYVAETLRPDPFEAFLPTPAEDEAGHPVAADPTAVTTAGPSVATSEAVATSVEPARVRERA
jgi:hypothetical protein